MSDDAGGTSVAAASAATDETGHGVVLRPPVLRSFQGERHASWLELFFDLCFVAAVAALAAGLRETPTTEGLFRFAGLFVPVLWGLAMVVLMTAPVLAGARSSWRRSTPATSPSATACSP